MRLYAETVLPILSEVRSLVMPGFGSAAESGRKSASAHDIVTNADIAVERFLASMLEKRFPDIGFVGEENGGDRSRDRFWLCDPIDGTMLYARGIPMCTTMLALIEDGVVTFGVIYDFVHDTMYHAQRGQGAFEDTRRIHVSSRPSQDGYLFTEMDTRTDAYARLTYMALRDRYHLLATMTAGYEYALVASGRFEGRVNVSPFGNDYDYAPGSIIVQEAGGVVANLGKRTYDYRDTGCIVASRAVFEDLTQGERPILPVR